MKKMLTIALTLTFALSLGTTAFAATIDESRKQDIDVQARYKDSVDSPTVFNVDVSWGEMAFTYTVSGSKTWDPEKHDYTTSTSDEWTATGNEITVTNHSNTAIKTDFTYTPANGHNTVTGSFAPQSVTLPTAEGKNLTDATLTSKSALTLGGTLADTTTNLTKVGTATVAIGKA